MIAAIFISRSGPYWKDLRFDAWDAGRDARKYLGGHRVIAHPPCERWGRYWGGGPMLHGTSKQKKLGDDDGCFESALLAVRSFGGVLEHPEASHAWSHFGLNKPPRNGGWVKADDLGGWTCCVAQGNYGHRAQKLTWLYYNMPKKPPELKWGTTPGRDLLDQGFHSKEERARLIKTGVGKRLSKNQRTDTPKEFMELLVRLVENE